MKKREIYKELSDRIDSVSRFCLQTQAQAVETTKRIDDLEGRIVTLTDFFEKNKDNILEDMNAFQSLQAKIEALKSLPEASNGEPSDIYGEIEKLKSDIAGIVGFTTNTQYVADKTKTKLKAVEAKVDELEQQEFGKREDIWAAINKISSRLSSVEAWMRREIYT